MFSCPYCERQVPYTETEIDHKTPVSRGGTDSPSNLHRVCRDCNRKKSDKTDMEFRAEFLPHVLRYLHSI